MLSRVLQRETDCKLDMMNFAHIFREPVKRNLFYSITTQDEKYINILSIIKHYAGQESIPYLPRHFNCQYCCLSKSRDKVVLYMK